MKNRFSLLFGFLALFAIAALERFYHLTQIGLDGSDTFFYWDMAREYLSGNFAVSEHYRPLAYGLYALAMAVGGVNFYSIKFLNCGLDLLNGGLIALIAYRISKKPYVALASTALYFAMVQPVIQARSELLHIPSMTPFLVSFLIFTYAIEKTGQPIWKWSSLLLFAGGFLGTSANIHPTTALIAPGFVLAIILWSLTRETSQSICRALMGTASFSLGFAIPFIKIAIWMGGKDVSQSLASNRGAQTEGLNKLGGNLLWGLKSFIPDNTSWLIAGFFALALVYVLAKRILRRRPFAWTTILVLMLTYALLYLTLVPKYRLTRTFLPLIPLMLAWLTAVVWDFSQSRPHIQKQIARLGFLLIAIISLRHSVPAPYLWSLHQRPTVYLEIQKTLADIKPSDQILVIPLIASHHRGPMAQKAYFGPQAHYLIHQPVTDLKAMMTHGGFTHVVFLKENWDYRITSQAELDVRSFKKRLKPYFNWQPEDYDPNKEFALWQQSLPAWGYPLMIETERFAIWRKP